MEGVSPLNQLEKRNENNGRIITFPATVQMLKRESCSHTKHDSSFSQWKILIGPSDWEDYSKGKEGSTRYRIQNLPENPGPGVYELGVAVSTSGLGRQIYKLATTEPRRVVVVYLGKADNVRTRLQSYGRNGAHLGNGCSSFASSVQMGHSLFHEIFFQGFPIVYRWAPMQNKGDALQTESQLLSTFDYAWNAINNGTRRPDDILQMLNKISSGTRTFSDVAKSLLPFTQKKVGIPIKSRKSPTTDDKSDEADNGGYNFLSRVFKFNRSRPKIVQVQDIADFEVEKNGKICGVILDDGSICTNTPVEKRVRCHEHKGMRINTVTTKAMRRSKSESENVFTTKEIRRSKSESEKMGESFVDESITKTVICGIVSEDGLTCRKEPVKGRKRCHEHKGKRIRASVSLNQK